jgi:hypothetical protein
MNGNARRKFYEAMGDCAGLKKSEITDQDVLDQVAINRQQGADLTDEDVRDILGALHEMQEEERNLYIYDGDSDGGQVIYDGPLSEHDDSHSDPALLAAIEEAKANPGKHIRGADKEGCPFTVLVS